MGRTQRALTSLVAAIPAGFLAYILVMTFLNQADSLTTMIQIILGVTLACAVLVVLMPFGLLIFGGERAARPETAAAKSAPARKGAAVDDDEAVDVADDGDGGDLFDDSSEDVGLETSDDEILADSDDEISASSSATMDAFDFDEDEDEPPKKKKK